MFRTKHLPLIILSISLLALIIFAPSYGWHVRAFFSGNGSEPSNTQNLIAQNDALKAQVAEYQTVESQLPDYSANYVRAMIYSREPMNFRNEFLINVGQNEGIMAGNAVVVEASSSYVLVGKVETVFAETSLIQTVFDPGFKVAARVGASGYDALLEGGASPVAASLPKSAGIEVGDAVFSADPTLPYGLAIGTVTSVGVSPDSLFQVAQLELPYDLNTVQTVMVAK